MKARKVNWLHFIYFFFGVFVCYILQQYNYLEIEYKFNIPELTISIITALIGLYIATSIQKNINRTQSISNYLQNKFEACLLEYNKFAIPLESSNSISISSLNIPIKNLLVSLSRLKSLFISFKIDPDLINSIEANLDSLHDNVMNNSSITNNIADYSAIQTQIKKDVSHLSLQFSNLLKQIIET